MGAQGRNPASLSHKGVGSMAMRRALTSQSRTVTARELSEGKTIICTHGTRCGCGHMGLQPGWVPTTGWVAAGVSEAAHQRRLYRVVDGGHGHEVDVACHARAAMREDAATRPEGRHAPG